MEKQVISKIAVKVNKVTNVPHLMIWKILTEPTRQEAILSQKMI